MVGIVEQVGSSVSHLKKGDTVGRSCISSASCSRMAFVDRTWEEGLCSGNKQAQCLCSKQHCHQHVPSNEVHFTTDLCLAGVGWFRSACLECDSCIRGDDVSIFLLSIMAVLGQISVWL